MSAPIAIGGVGGSGTRVVADLVAALGVDLGPERNSSGDTLAFTLLFKRPHHFAFSGGMVEPTDPAAAAAVDLFFAVMTHDGVTPARLARLGAAAVDMVLHTPPADVALAGDRRSRRVRALWAARRVRSMTASLGAPRTTGAWGWKEPNTFAFLPALYRREPTLRYVHVVRNGLDMAYSRNDGQLRAWGPLFACDDADTDHERAQLRYWARVNMTVDAYLHDRPGTLVLRYEDVTERPLEALQRIGDLLGIEPTDQARAVAADLQPSKSKGRFEERDYRTLLGRAGDDVASALAHFGY